MNPALYITAFLLTLIIGTPVLPELVQTPKKSAGVFFSARLMGSAKRNAARYSWAADIRQQVIDAAQPWARLSDDELWGLMFGSTIKRSWMVWSDGYCPSCKKGVPMYTWQMDAMNNPWKVICPHCKEVFPKNDFYKFYKSGLDEHCVFNPTLADRSLLFNTAHPDAKDPLHLFGVDDGGGYTEGDKRWRFIGAYLVYGQWKRAVLGGIKALAAAYVVSGDRLYARKAGILLDRVADLYPTFDFLQQGEVYEDRAVGNGYVSIWHDACEETRELALAYDEVFDGIKHDTGLVEFLARKASDCKLENPKKSFVDIQRNIEGRILRDALANRKKIESNYPRTDIANAVMKTVLEWPENRMEVEQILDALIRKASAVDGVAGEKGLSGYGAIGPQATYELLSQYMRLDKNFLRNALKRHPRLYQMYRFHFDTWCGDKLYYPYSGDSGWFAHKAANYAGVGFNTKPGIAASGFTFMWQMYKLTGDHVFAQQLYRANNLNVEGLPHDLFVEDPESIQKGVSDVIKRVGLDFKLGSVNKKEWHIAILRSGAEKDQRDLWLDYDSGHAHGHLDGMNLGLFSKGLDLLPDFGYPPVQMGGWNSPHAKWFKGTSSHNTVVVDGRNQGEGDGVTTLWADGREFRAVRASGAALIGGRQYERTAVLVDISDKDSYVLDVFRVEGGSDHAKFTHSQVAKMSTQGVSLIPAPAPWQEVGMRRFMTDPKPSSGWSADWDITDFLNYLPKNSSVHLRYTDLTTDAEAYTAEQWVATGGYDSTNEAWIPCVMVRRRSPQSAQENVKPLKSTFVSIIEPYQKHSSIAGIHRLPVISDSDADSQAAIEVELVSGGKDMIISMNADAGAASQRNGRVEQWELILNGELGWVRKDASGRLNRLAICGGRSLEVGDTRLELKADVDFIEIALDNDVPKVLSGDPYQVQELVVNGRDIWKAQKEDLLRLQASYYQQFDADPSLDVPAEGYGGWKKAAVDLSLSHTAVVVMHAWDFGKPDTYPGWRRAVEYTSRADKITRDVFPKLLKAVRSSGMKLFHVVGGGDYYKSYPGYKLAVGLAGKAPPSPSQIESDASLDALREFRRENVFVGLHNELDVQRGFDNTGFPKEAEPADGEPVAENGQQLLALCKHYGVNHLIYAGFAINWCLLLSPGGMAEMSSHGVMCSALRQAVTAVENKESARLELAKELGLWRVALAYGFVFDVDDLIRALDKTRP